MSTNETAPATPATPKVETEKLSKTFKLYNLDTMKMVPVELKDIEFTPAADSKEAFARIGNDEKVLLEALNALLKSKTISDAKKSKMPTNSASKKTVLDFIKNFRVSPTFSSMVTLEKGQPGWKPQYDKQTDAILSQISQVPFMMDNLRAIAAAAPDTDDETDE